MVKETVVDFQSLVDAIENPNIINPQKIISQKTTPQTLSIFQDREYWSLYQNNQSLQPLKFSNGKTQEDVVKEIVNLIKEGKKVIFLHGVCGTGKSAIALNIARKLGKTSIVVPVKALQSQYEQDYTNKKYVMKANGQKMKIGMITGRDNHSAIIQDTTCADPFLPDTIKINEKNYTLLRDFYYQNPLIKNKSAPMLKDIKRISIAPANPYWSPILPAKYDAPLEDAKKKPYRGLEGKDYIFYHRKEGCSYYDQYQSYIDADVIIFNSAKYKIELALNRKPETQVDIIDEADEFLDNFSSQQSLNLTRLAHALSFFALNSKPTQITPIEEIHELVKLEEKKRQILGINESEIIPLKETNLAKILKKFADNPEIEDEAMLDESSYISSVYEVANIFLEFIDDTYVSFRKDEQEIIASLVTTNISKRFKELMEKTKSLVLMSGTLHSKDIIENIYGVKQYGVVNAETQTPGTMEIIRTGLELDCSYAKLKSRESTRENYLKALAECVKKAPRPTLVHVNSFEDLPSTEEIARYELYALISKESLRESQRSDKTSRDMNLFKNKMKEVLFTTRCSRGVDFPGDMCNSIIFTKFPNPNPREIFWRVLEKTHKPQFWSFYRDKARREFLQRLYRALRSPEDYVYILSPDTRVLDKVKELQNSN